MKKLIIARHGDYGNPDPETILHLNDHGRLQIRRLAEEIRSLVTDDKVIILSSTADRARLSAEIIGAILNLEHQSHEILWSDRRHPYNPVKALELIREYQDDVSTIILVTHLEYGEQLPGYFGRKVLGGAHIDGWGIEKGHAWVIDCESKSITRLAPTL